MKCPSCHTDHAVPCIFGNPNQSSWKADMLGLVNCSGLGGTDQPTWLCKNCSNSFEAGTNAQYLAAIAHAQEVAETIEAPWLDRPDAQQISIGRKVLDLMIGQFRGMNARRVRITKMRKIEAMFNAGYEPIEWALGEKYAPNMIKAIVAGACDHISKSKTPIILSGDTLEIRYLED